MTALIHCKAKFKINSDLVVFKSDPTKIAYVNQGDEVSFGPQDSDTCDVLKNYQTLRGAVNCRRTRRSYIVEVPRKLIYFTNERIPSNA